MKKYQKSRIIVFSLQFIFLFLIYNVSSQMGYNNPRYPKIERELISSAITNYNNYTNVTNIYGTNSTFNQTYNDALIYSYNFTDILVSTFNSTYNEFAYNQTHNTTAFFKKIGVGKINSAATIPIEILTMNGGQGFRIEMTTATDKSFSTFTTGDSFTRFSFDGNGLMLFGAGTSAGDTNLFRDSANVLRTNDNFIVDGKVGIGTTTPTEILTVSGNFSAGNIFVGNITSSYLEDSLDEDLIFAVNFDSYNFVGNYTLDGSGNGIHGFASQVMNQHLDTGGFNGAGFFDFNITNAGRSAINFGHVNTSFGDYSWSWWARFNGMSNLERTFSQREATGNSQGWEARTETGNNYNWFVWYSDGASDTCALEANDMQLGVWYHFVVSMDRDGNMNCYRNAVRMASGDISDKGNLSIEEDITDFVIGGSLSETVGFNGSVDDMRIYSKVLNEQEILRLYQDKVDSPQGITSGHGILCTYQGDCQIGGDYSSLGLANLVISDTNLLQYYLSSSTTSAIYIEFDDTSGNRDIFIGSAGSSGTGIFGSGDPYALEIGSQEIRNITFHTGNDADPVVKLLKADNNYHQLTVGYGSNPGCLMMRDTDGAGWTELAFLNGAIGYLTADTNGVCDGL